MALVDGEYVGPSPRSSRSCDRVSHGGSCSPAPHLRAVPDLHRWTDDVYANATADEITAETALSVFFSGSEDSRARGMECLQRTQRRQADRDAPTDLPTRDAQLSAITAWGIPDASKLNRLAGIIQPTFVAVGDQRHDDARSAEATTSSTC